MSAKIIRGTELREEILEEITREVETLKGRCGRSPGLVTILVGENPRLDLLRDKQDTNGETNRLQGGAGEPSGGGFGTGSSCNDRPI